MMLTIDAGNTRTKWALFDETANITWQGVCTNQEIGSAAFLPANTICTRANVANVAGAAHADLLQNRLHQLSISEVNWVKATPRACGVINSYAQPETLGIDRWAALVGAWYMAQGVCVVVNAGTAVTIDALGLQRENNQDMGLFKGGIILPGLQLMHQALGTATAQLPDLSATAFEPIQHDIFAKSTAEAIHSGVLHAISGAITLMSHSLNGLYKTRPKVILSGGNANIIKENLIADVTRQTHIVDNLVLHGLHLLSTNA